MNNGEKRKMKVLIISHFFYPEMMAIAKRVMELGETLIEQGNEVTVLTGFPNYPDGIVLPEYRGKLFQVEYIKRMKVIRTCIYASHNKIFGARLANNISFMASSILRGFFLKDKPEVILAISPPLFTGVSAYVLSKFMKIPFVFDVQDMYPDTAIDFGMLKNRYAISSAKWLEKRIYQGAKKIAVISNGFKENLVHKGIDSGKIEIIPNWVDTNRFHPNTESKHIRQEFNLTNKFVVIFVGSLGIGQKPQNIILTADKLKTQKDIMFVFVGGGVEKKECILLQQKLGLQNVLFIPPQPMEIIPNYIVASDVCLVHLRDIPVFNITVPSKTYEYMASSRPIIMAVKGDAKKLVENARCGLYVEPENPDLLAKAILTLYDDKRLGIEYGKNGRVDAVENYSKDIVTSYYMQMLSNILSIPKN